MLKRINNWHLSALVTIVSIFSLVLVQQYVSAQGGWRDPTSLPGGTPANNLVVTPMIENLQLGDKDILDTNIKIDGDGLNVIQISNGGKICFNGTTDCAAAWPVPGVSLWTENGSDIYYNLGNVGIGTSAPERLLEINAPGSAFGGAYPTAAARLRISATTAGKQGPGLEFFNIDKDNGTKIAKIVSRDAHIFSFEYENKGEDEGSSQEQLLVIDNNRNVGIGTATPSYPLEVNGDISAGDYFDAYDSTPTQGTRLFLNGANTNSDPLWLARYNVSSDKTELRIGIGDNTNEWWPDDFLDKLVVGATDSYATSTSGGPNYYDGKKWYPRFTMTSEGNFGIGTTTPNKQLHIVSSAGKNAEIDIQSGLNMHWGMYQDDTSGDLRFWNSDDRLVLESSATNTNLKLHNNSGDIKLIFQEYDTPPTNNGDISIRYNGNNPAINGGFANWLEFWGRDPLQGGGRPIMTMQRDYDASKTNYLGVGIGVPALENINAKLRVQNYGTEDILQLYDDTNQVFTVKDGGNVCINGDCRSAWPVGSSSIQLPIVTTVTPPSVDCDEPSEQGTMILAAGSGSQYDKVWFCAESVYAGGGTYAWAILN